VAERAGASPEGAKEKIYAPNSLGQLLDGIGMAKTGIFKTIP
jgi:hypothetical protein